MRDTTFAESHTTLQNGEWLELRIDFAPEDSDGVLSLPQPGNVFKDVKVLNPEWDELEKMAPGDVVEAEVVDQKTVTTTTTGKLKKRKAAEMEEEEEDDDDDDDDDEVRLPTPPATTRPTRAAARAAGKAVSKLAKALLSKRS